MRACVRVRVCVLFQVVDVLPVASRTDEELVHDIAGDHQYCQLSWDMAHDVPSVFVEQPALTISQTLEVVPPDLVPDVGLAYDVSNGHERLGDCSVLADGIGKDIQICMLSDQVVECSQFLQEKNWQ